MDNWGVFQQGLNRHVVPMVTLDGEVVASANHVLDRKCPCNPINLQDITSEWPHPIWNHNDPDHPGSEQS